MQRTLNVVNLTFRILFASALNMLLTSVLPQRARSGFGLAGVEISLTLRVLKELEISMVVIQDKSAMPSVKTRCHAFPIRRLTVQPKLWFNDFAGLAAVSRS